LDSGQIDGGLCSDLHGQTLNVQRSTFNVQFRISLLRVGRWTFGVGR
jgi:hypothetical protein